MLINTPPKKKKAKEPESPWSTMTMTPEAKTKKPKKAKAVKSKNMTDLDDLPDKKVKKGTKVFVDEPEDKPKKTKLKKKAKVKAKVKAKDRRIQKEYVVALASERPRQRISKINSKKLKSIMGDSAEDIQQLLEQNDGDTARSMMYKKMLQSLVDLIPYAENNIRKTKGARGVYQLNSMISSIRELLIDVQSSQDRGRIGELMVEKIIAPAILEMGTSIVQKFDFIASDARLRLKRSDFKVFKAELDVHKKDLADVINAKFYEIQNEVKAYLQR